MKSYIYKAMLASSSLFLLVSSPSMAQEAKKGGNSQVVTADADQGVSRQFTFTSGARIDKPLLTIAGGSERKTCSLWQRQNGKDVQVALPSKLTFSNACQLTGVADPVTEPQSAEYQVQVRDGTQGMIAKNVRITINPPLSVKCDPVVMTAGGEISVSQLPCQARGGTGATAIKYVGVDGKILTELPGGLKIDERGGISGKVPENTDSLKGVAIQFADAGGATVRAPITLDIRPPITMDVENVQITANGMTTPATIDPPLPVANISGGSGQITVQILDEDGKKVASLPEGVRFNGVTKQLEGSVPLAKDMGEKKYMLKATDQGGGTIRRVFVLKVNPPLSAS